jgi:hypothetical protein
MSRPQAERDYERLMRREISPTEYWLTLRQEAQNDVQRVLTRRRMNAKAA